MNITEHNLTGEINNFPIEVVEKMVEEQMNQGNKPNVNLFTIDKCATRYEGGFNWESTRDGFRFWEKIIKEELFDLFFERYPRKLKTNKLVYIYNEVNNNGSAIIKTLENYGGINRYNLSGNEYHSLYYIEPNTNEIKICRKNKDNKLYNLIKSLFTEVEVDYIEITLEDIAKKFNVDVSQLKIKDFVDIQKP